MTSRWTSVSIALAVVATLASGARAQNAAPTAPGVAAATGVVVGPSAEPQVGVPVVVQGPKGVTQAFTDAKGSWRLYNLPPGEYKVKPATNAATDASVSFTVKEQGVFDRMFGKEPPQITTNVMKLDRDVKM